jgi:uncharacterized protein YbjT (DUF2867 family)
VSSLGRILDHGQTATRAVAADGNAAMKILVVGATGGCGRAAVEELLSAGHDVAAFSRHASVLRTLSDRLNVVTGNAMDKSVALSAA